MPRLIWTVNLLSVLPHIARMIGACCHAQPLVEMVSLGFLAHNGSVEGSEHIIQPVNNKRLAH
jgi:hypothetical protein